MNKTTIIFLMSDNYYGFVSEAAYHEIRIRMSSGDFGSHRHREVQVDANQLERVRWGAKRGFVDVLPMDDEGSTELFFAFYDGCGDCNYEPVFQSA